MGASLLVFKNKSDISGCMTDEEIVEVRKLFLASVVLTSLCLLHGKDRSGWHLRLQALDLNSIKTHTWKILACSAMTGLNLQQGIHWVVQDAKDRLFLYWVRWYSSGKDLCLIRYITWYIQQWTAKQTAVSGHRFNLEELGPCHDILVDHLEIYILALRDTPYTWRDWCINNTDPRLPVTSCLLTSGRQPPTFDYLVLYIDLIPFLS